MPGGDINGYVACWERRPYNTVLVSAGNGKVFDLDPDVIFNPSVTSIGVVGFRYILILNLVSIVILHG
jgi:hypothetical protein